MSNFILRQYERITNDESSIFQKHLEEFAFDLRVAAPAIVQSVDYENQTIDVKIALREQNLINKETQELEATEIPLLPGVPFFILSGGDYNITFPIKEGDECLVIFADMPKDSWWQNGDIQDPIKDARRHDLSDGFALIGFRSQPEKLENYSEDSFQVRNKDGSVYVELKDDDISLYTENGNISAECKGELTIKADKIKLDAPSGIELTGNSQTKIDGKTFLQHMHSNGNEGANTGAVV